ncbi:hypothetical protein Tco_0676633 [Tanacetum coccineum]
MNVKWHMSFIDLQDHSLRNRRVYEYILQMKKKLLIKKLEDSEVMKLLLLVIVSTADEDCRKYSKSLLLLVVKLLLLVLVTTARRVSSVTVDEPSTTAPIGYVPVNVTDSPTTNLEESSQVFKLQVEKDDDLGTNGRHSKSTGKGPDYDMFPSEHIYFNVASSSTSITPVVERINKIERQIIDEKLTLLDNDGKPLPNVVSTENVDSDS